MLFGLRYLKIKIKSLAEESRIIRFEERRITVSNPEADSLRESLRGHRVRDVRSEQRATLLAYAFLRGRSLRSQERRAVGPMDPKVVARVTAMVKKYGAVGSEHLVKEWFLKGAAASEDEQEVSNSESGFDSRQLLQSARENVDRMLASPNHGVEDLTPTVRALQQGGSRHDADGCGNTSPSPTVMKKPGLMARLFG